MAAVFNCCLVEKNNLFTETLIDSVDDIYCISVVQFIKFRVKIVRMYMLVRVE